MIQIEEKDLKEAVTMALGSQGIWTPELASTMFIEIQKQALNIDDVSNRLDTRHPKCLGDGVDDCGYNTTIDCEDCKFNNAHYGKKDPAAKCNQ